MQNKKAPEWELNKPWHVKLIDIIKSFVLVERKKELGRCQVPHLSRRFPPPPPGLKRRISLKIGDKVFNKVLGDGIVIGFSEISENPDVYFYDTKKVLCIDVSKLQK